MKKVLEVVSNVSKKASDMKEDSGIEPSLTHEEIHDYLDYVMEEVRKNRGSVNK